MFHDRKLFRPGLWQALYPGQNAPCPPFSPSALCPVMCVQSTFAKRARWRKTTDDFSKPTFCATGSVQAPSDASLLRKYLDDFLPKPPFVLCVPLWVLRKSARTFVQVDVLPYHPCDTVTAPWRRLLADVDTVSLAARRELQSNERKKTPGDKHSLARFCVLVGLLCWFCPWKIASCPEKGGWVVLRTTWGAYLRWETSTASLYSICPGTYPSVTKTIRFGTRVP